MILTDNGKILMSPNGKVYTGIAPTGTYQVTENGEYDITEYAKVNVNVASSSGADMMQTKVDTDNSCRNLFLSYLGDNVDYIKDLNTSNVTTMSSMF